MSEQVKFVVYYGSGNVRATKWGADLSEFSHVELQLTDPEKTNISWLQYYLTVNFGLDPEAWTVNIQSLWTKSRTNIFWELIPIDRTKKWVAWLASCKRWGTHPVVLMLAVPKQYLMVQGGGGYEPSQGSQTTNEMDASGSEPVDQWFTNGAIKQTVSVEVHEQDLRMAKEALNSNLDLKGIFIQDFWCNLGNNSSRILGKNLSNHQIAEASCMGNHMEQNGKSLDGCIQLDSRNQNTSLAEDSRIDGDMFKSKRKGPLLQEKPEIHEKNGGEEAGTFRPTKRRRYIAIEDEEDGGDQHLVGVDCGGEEAEYCRLTKKRRRYIANEDEEDDGIDQNLAGVEGGTAGLTTQAAIMKDQRTEVSKPFISDSGKLQRYSCLPIDEPIWSGILKVGSKEYFSLAAHLSAKCCERAWKLSRSLKRVVEVTNISRLEAWPKSFEVSRPTDDNIALYFLPQEMRLDEDLDQLVKEVTENDTVLRAVVGEAEMLIFPSILLPEQHQTFQRKLYLWGVFKRREDKVAVVEEQQHCTGRCAQEEEIEKQPASNSGVQKDGCRVAGINMAAGLEAPKQAERQGMEQELTPLLARPNAPHLAEGAARPTSAPTTSAVLPHSTLAVPSGAVFGFIVRQTPRLERLIQEMEREGDVVVAMRGGGMIASGLGQPTATG